MTDIVTITIILYCALCGLPPLILRLTEAGDYYHIHFTDEKLRLREVN